MVSCCLQLVNTNRRVKNGLAGFATMLGRRGYPRFSRTLPRTELTRTSDPV